MNEPTEKFYNDLVEFYKDAPANEHTLELVIKNIEECKKREQNLLAKYNELKKEYNFLKEVDHYHLSFARETAEYYKKEASDLKQQLKSIIFNSERAELIDKINQGLKSECKRYKKLLEEKKIKNKK